MDYEVCRKVWETQVAAQFTLQDEEALPLYLMLPRCSYFVTTIQKVINFFSSREGGEKIESDKIWLEANGVPLKMYLPIGVLHDLQNITSEGTWNITVKLSARPPGYVSVDRDSMESMFIQSVKEADYLKQKAEVTNNMHREEHKLLWKSIANYHFDDFWSINKKLMDTSEKMFDYIPLRVYKRDKPFRQMLLASRDESGALTTVGSAAVQLLKLNPDETVKLVSHGICIPPETPLIYAAKNLSYPDNFVHICVHS